MLWWWIIIFVVTAAIGGYFLYKKYADDKIVPAPVGDIIIITEEGATVEKYIEIPLAQNCLMRSNDNMSMCASITDETEMNYVYDPIGGSINSDGAFKTTYDSDEQKCSDGTMDCVYEEKFSDDRKLIGITNAKGEDLIQKFIDDVWSGKIDFNKKVPHLVTREMTVLKEQFKDIIEFDKTTGEMYFKMGERRIKIIPGYIDPRDMAENATEMKITVGIMILYIIFYYYGNDLPKPTITLDLKSEKTLGQVYKEIKEASQSPQP